MIYFQVIILLMVLLYCFRFLWGKPCCDGRRVCLWLLLVPTHVCFRWFNYIHGRTICTNVHLCALYIGLLIMLEVIWICWWDLLKWILTSELVGISDPTSCVFASTTRDHPIHLWDATTGLVLIILFQPICMFSINDICGFLHSL